MVKATPTQGRRRGLVSALKAFQTRILGLRQRPGIIALAVFRTMPWFYRAGAGRAFGHAFLVLHHQGRLSGKPYTTALKVAEYNSESDEAVVVAIYGRKADWMRNIEANPPLEVEIAGGRYVPTCRILNEEEALRAMASFRKRHPALLRLFSLVFGWGALSSDTDLRAFLNDRVFVAFRPKTETTPLAAHARVQRVA